MNFEELIKLVSTENPPNVCTDSRAVKSGDIFVAIKGTVSDGHEFIEQAISNGAKYIVCEKNARGTGILPVHTWAGSPCHKEIIVKDSVLAAAILAQASKGNPSSKLINMAVTGTNGKTTVTYLVRSCINYAGEKCGMIGTVIYDDCSGKSTNAPLTTPDSLTIAEKQAAMLNNGAKCMITEASSHALSQNRLAYINFKAAAFTNLTGDHLDYHKTKQNYLESKTKLFTSLTRDSFAILNAESPESQCIAQNTKANIIWYAIEQPVESPQGIERKADLIAKIESMKVSGTVFTLNYMGQSAKVRTPLIGMYNISNHLAAAGLCLGAGLDLQTIAQGLSSLYLIPGRLEKVELAEGERAARNERQATILIDYAHTDDALKNVLSILKPLCKGKLRVIFGCGGDRDKTKRPRMAQAAEQYADYIIVTSDNPRTEEPHVIIEDILKGFENPKSGNISVIEDRKKAIEMTIQAAGKNDIILIAGKGHEDYQIIGKTKHHFSDKEIAQACLQEK